jgi:hypothetical protein
LVRAGGKLRRFLDVGELACLASTKRTPAFDVALLFIRGGQSGVGL